MIDVTLTTDVDLIRSVLTDHTVWDGISEDGNDIETFTIPPLTFFTFIEDDVLLGIAGVRLISSACIELHTALLRNSAGRAVEVFKTFEIFLLKQTLVESVITFVPESNPKALRAALNAGFTEVGIIPKSFRKNGNLVGQRILQVSL